MTDVVSAPRRREMMAGIKGKDTRPEMFVRQALHREGFRFRLHDKRLPGHPDLVLPRYGAVIFVHGCFWHRHDCHLFKWPTTRPEFWRAKINRNVSNDQKHMDALRSQGWRILTVWECALKGKTRRAYHEVIHEMVDWILSEEFEFEIRGT